MKRKRYTEEQIISILKEQEAGMPAPEVIRIHGHANRTFYRWKEKFGGMEVSDARRLKELESENAKLKKLLAETLLEKTAIEEVLQKSGETVAPLVCGELFINPVFVESASGMSYRSPESKSSR